MLPVGKEPSCQGSQCLFGVVYFDSYAKMQYVYYGSLFQGCFLFAHGREIPSHRIKQ